MSLHVSSWVYPEWGSLHLLDLGGYFLSHVREVFNYNLFKYFLWPFLFHLFFWDPCNLSVVAFNVVPEVPETVLFPLHPFIFLYSVLWQLFLPFCFLAQFSILLPQLFCYWFLLEFFVCFFLFVFFNYYVVHHCPLVLLVPCEAFLVFSWLMSPFCFQDLGIIFTIITPNSFSGRLSVWFSFILSCRFLPCYFYLQNISVSSHFV